MITKTKIELAKEHLKECKTCFANDGKCPVQSELLDMINKYEPKQKFDNAISCKFCNVKMNSETRSSNTFLSFLFYKDDSDKDLTIVGANLDLEKLLVAQKVIKNKISEFKGEM